MALNPAAVRVGITGAVYKAPSGVAVTAPTGIATALDTDLEDLGFVGEDGVEEGYDDDVTDFRAWQSGQVVRSVVSGSKATLKMTFIEDKRAVVEAYHKGSTIVAGTALGEFRLDVKGAAADPCSWALDVVDGTIHKRLWIERGEVTKRDPIKYSIKDMVAYGIEMTIYPVNGVLLTKWSNDILWTPAA